MNRYGISITHDGKIPIGRNSSWVRHLDGTVETHDTFEAAHRRAAELQGTASIPDTIYRARWFSDE